MAPLELDGANLKEKHQHYNKLVKDAITNNKPLTSLDLVSGDNDVENLMKIDIACARRDVEFVLEVLECEDMMYVSRVLKQAVWLVERQYSHIFNPEHLAREQLPRMTAAAAAKLMLHLRLRLNDPQRAQQFYEYLKDENIKVAMKWLPYCSVGYIETEVEKHHGDMEWSTVKRLFEKSITIFEKYLKKIDYNKRRALKYAMFYLKTDTEKFLDIYESLGKWDRPSFGAQQTATIMKKCPQRVNDKFEAYADRICIKTFAKLLKQEEIKDFLLKQSKNKELERDWFGFDNLKHFAAALPKEGRFEFLKKFFIDKSSAEDLIIPQNESQSDMYGAVAMCLRSCDTGSCGTSSANIYRWYRFAPFEVAFQDLSKLIRAESAPNERIAMLGVILSCAGRNLDHLKTLIQYYNERHINEPFKFKIQFVNMVLSKSELYKLDKATWSFMYNIFHSMEVFVESDNNVQSCIEAIIVHKLLNGEEIPDIINNKFKFTTMKQLENKLGQDEKTKVFTYLLQMLLKKLENKNVKIESDLTEQVNTLENIFSLLIDWNKNIADYPSLIEKVKDMIKLKEEHGWATDLSKLYTKDKRWRRVLFEESLEISGSDESCYNALKHDASLLARHGAAVERLRRQDSVHLRRVLSALRVYWPQSLAREWLAAYQMRTTQAGSHGALVRGLASLLPLAQLSSLLREYAPSEKKINWSEDDPQVLSLRKYLAKNMHLSRPLPSVDIILLYAQGDYLQFAIPSLSAILYDMKSSQAKEHVSKLLDAPVSLQKHGIRFAFTKLESEDLKEVFVNLWKKSKNPSIRAVLFKQTYDLMCREKKPSMIEDIWQLLSMFIDNLSSDENKIIYQTLYKYDKVPQIIKGKYFMKSYKCMKSLQAKANCESYLNSLIYDMTDMIDQLDEEFVEDIIMEDLDKKFTTQRFDKPEIMASYILCSQTEKTQMEKYNKVLLPVLERAFALWDVKISNCVCVSTNAISLLGELEKHFQKYVLKKKMIFPIKLFEDILERLEKSLSVEQTYTFLRTWKFIVAFIKTLNDFKKSILDFSPAEDEDSTSRSSYYNPKSENKWNEIYKKAIPTFSKVCLEVLKQDVDKYFPSIYNLLGRSLNQAFENINEAVYMEVLKSMLDADSSVVNFLMVLKCLPDQFYSDEDEVKNCMKEIREKLVSHPSAEVKMHYFQKYTRHDLDCM